jgi:hypothetical protein
MRCSFERYPDAAGGNARTESKTPVQIYADARERAREAADCPIGRG